MNNSSSNYNEDLDLCSKVFSLWAIKTQYGEVIPFTKEYEEQSFIAKMLRKKIKVFHLPIELPDPLCILIEICTNGNPAKSQMMLKDILVKRKGTSEMITSADFADVYGDEFPIIMNGNKWDKYFRVMWLNQKDENGGNKCDTPEWWLNNDQCAQK